MRDGFTSTLLDPESENILLSKCLLAVLLILSGLCHNAADATFSVFGNGVSRSQTVAHKASGGPSRTRTCSLSDTQWPPSEDLPVKNCFLRLSGRFPLGAFASASTNTDNICEGNKRQFAISAAHAQVIFQPVSPAVEGFECRALDTLPFWKFIYALRGWAVFPSTQFHYI